MRDLDDYLDQLRGALDVTPKRADEICEEVRSHLRARASELMAKGSSEREAAAEAVAEFGAPRQMAAQLTQANSRHRRANRILAVLGFMVVFSAMLTVSVFWQAPTLRNGVRISRDMRAMHWLAVYTPLTLMQAKSLLGFLVVLPAAVLAGMVAGRRRWWIAGLPPVFWSSVVSSLLFLGARHSHPAVNFEFVGVVRTTLISALVMAGCGYLGSRALKRKSAAWLVGLVCGGYLTLTAVAVSGMMLAGVFQAAAIPGNIWLIVILAFELSVLLLGALVYRGYRQRQISA
jgi:hypothetical protein